MSLLPVLEGLHSAEALHPAFLRAFFARVAELEARPEEADEALRGRLVAHVFSEPSTRTRLSFEAAAQRCGAGVLSVADAANSSAAKGESLADMARVIGGYADLLVLRHPADGASRLASQHAGVPVINGGDGRLGHPTQTLVDLYALHRRWGSLRGRTVGLLGDLRHARTARSLAWGLAVAGARIVVLPAPGLDWTSGDERRLLDRFDYRLRWCRHRLFRQWTGAHDVRVLEPRDVVQPRLFHEDVPALERLDALYVTRQQRERGAEADGGEYPRLRPQDLRDPLLEECLLLHPLPRREELPATLDADPRALYFEQARLGPMVRQVLLLAMLREDRWPLPAPSPLPAGHVDARLGPCPNAQCVTAAEGLPVPWRVAGRTRRSFLCAYCDTPLEVEYAGCRSTLRVHALHSASALRIRPENLQPFRDRDEALTAGYAWGGQGG